MENEQGKENKELNAAQGGESQPQAAQNTGKPAATGFNLGGGQGGAAYGREAELERQLQASKVEAGRVKALSRENAEMRDEIAKLRAELDRAMAALPHDYMGEVPEELRDKVDPEAIRAMGAMLDRRAAEAERRERERDEARAAADADAARRRFEDDIERTFPGFMSRTTAGGDLYDPWMRFLAQNGPSVGAAYDARNLGSLSTLINVFLQEAGVQGRGADTATPTPTPTAVSSADFSNPNGNKRVYSRDEYATILEDAGRKFREGAVTREGYMKIRDELSAAVREGRVQ